MKVTAIIQARMGSTRLPGKVLRQLCGESVLAHVVRRIQCAVGVDEVVVATTDLPGDDVIAAETAQLDASLFRGSESDVLGRYHGAALASGADVVVRVTSDCPLFDGQLLGVMLKSFADIREAGQRVDYLSNTLARTFPRGLDAEIFTFAALEAAHRDARDSFEREHVTPYLYRHTERFELRNFTAIDDYSEHRWTLDTIEDWRMIAAVYEALGGDGRPFGSADVLDLLRRHPEIQALNAHVEQKIEIASGVAEK